MTVTLFEIRIFVDVINLRILGRGDHPELSMGFESNDKQTDQTDPQRRHANRRLREYGAEGCSTSQRMLRVTTIWKRKRADSSPEPEKGGPIHTLTLDF